MPRIESFKMALFKKILQMIFVQLLFYSTFLLNFGQCLEIIRREYEVEASIDTFIHGPSNHWNMLDYLEIGQRGDGLESRALITFDLTRFVAESRWEELDSMPNLKQSDILLATLQLSCINVEAADSLYLYDRHFQNALHVGMILLPWEEAMVTSTIRSGDGWTWNYENIATDGTDATPPLSSSFANLSYEACQNGATVSFDLTSTLALWMNRTIPNYGVVIWAEDALLDRILLKFASSGSPVIDHHPIMRVTIQDTIIDNQGSSCGSSEFECLDGSCVPQSEVCDFRHDCLHNTDEESCGLSCDFESPCDWSRPLINTLNPGWELGDGTRSTPFTGPPGGYNPIGTAAGNFTFVDASGKWEGVTAQLRSPLYQETGRLCSVRFFYYMNGSDVGELKLWVAMGDQSYPIWQRSGSQGTRWMGDLVLLRSLSAPFRLVFEATMTGGESGDIALDDIQLVDCSPENVAPSCSSNSFQCMNRECVSRDRLCDLRPDCLFGEDEDEIYCGHIPNGAQCDFESGLCGWWDIVGSDHVNWTRHSGPTKSARTGPSVDHTLGTKEGYYIYLETSGPDPGNEAHIRSPVFEATPEGTRNRSSPLYQSCKLRFAYHMFGEGTGSLIVYAMDVENPQVSSQLFAEYYQNADRWIEIIRPLPQVISNRYYLQFEAIRGRNWKGDPAVDDISLSPECFADNITRETTTTGLATLEPGSTDTASWHTPSGPYIASTDQTTTQSSSTVEINHIFTTCGTHGPYGPTQAKCSSAYRHSNTTVRVLNADGTIQLPGVQVWIVPETRLYSITVYGASGGAGAENPGPSKAAMLEATFNLTAGVELYILVGQEGRSACSDPAGLFEPYCSGQMTEESKQQLGRNGTSAGGGGGGGGATFIAMLPEGTTELIPLLVSAGGGGLGFSPSPSTTYSYGRVGSPGPGGSGQHAMSTKDASGAGGGWNSTADHVQTGMSFLQGATGGRECLLAYEDYRWNTRGGFGGGGGACTTGGGGGGYTGGDAPLVKDLEGDGQGGMSFVAESAIDHIAVAGFRSGPGQVTIVGTIPCPEGSTRSGDKQGCLVATTPPPGRPSLTSTISISLILLAFVILTIVAITMVFKYKEHKLKEAENKMEASFRLSQLRANFSVDVNPCYTFPGKENGMSHELVELPRDNLRLISALGQGAFGEVFQGVYQPPNQKNEVDVAVKTLPEMCTEQDELDFLMEAVIMGNFSHPNIVSLVGVCFKEKPHFIVLEYMAGGELKKFLRDSRPTEEKPSTVTMMGLLKIAQDVAEGCHYLESRRFIHRDIAARNILLTCKDPTRVAKIADFGMARDIYRADYYRKGGQALLPVKWMPPEAFQDGVFTSKTDVWAFGVLLWEIISLGFMPYPGMSNQEVIQFVTSGERMNPPRNCPQPVFNLMFQCWRHLPEDRPSFATILESINYCLQDPDVLEMPLPKCLIERKKQLTIIRPLNPEKSPILRVERPIRSRDPSPCSSHHSSPLQHAPPRIHPGGGWDEDQPSCSKTPDRIYPGEDFGVGCEWEAPSIPAPPPSISSMTFSNKSYGLNNPSGSECSERRSLVPSEPFTDSSHESSDIPPAVVLKGNESEPSIHSAERSSLLNSANSDRSDQDRYKVDLRFRSSSSSSPRSKLRTSSLILPAPPKRQLMRGLSWNYGSSESPLIDPVPDLQRPSSLPGLSDSAIPDLLKSEVIKGSQQSGKRSVKRSLSGGGGLKQKLTRRLSREGKGQDSKPLVETDLDEVVISEQSHITHTEV